MSHYDTDSKTKERVLKLTEEALARFRRSNPDGDIAADEWKGRHERQAELIVDSEVVHSIESEPAMEAVVAYWEADVAEDHALHAARVARLRRENARLQLESTLAEEEGVFLDSKLGDRLNLEQLCVCRPNRIAQRRRLVNVSKTIAQGEPGEVELSDPDAAHVAEFTSYYGDLIRLFSQGGMRKRKQALQIIESRQVAATVSGSRNAEDPLLFLADCVTATTAGADECGDGAASGNYL